MVEPTTTWDLMRTSSRQSEAPNHPAAPAKTLGIFDREHSKRNPISRRSLGAIACAKVARTDRNASGSTGKRPVLRQQTQRRSQVKSAI